MLIHYTPAQRVYDGPPKVGEIRDIGDRTLVFRPSKLHSVEAEAIEDVTDWTYQEFQAKFLKGSMKAHRAAIWVLLKREFPTLKFKDLSFSSEEIEVEYEADELERMREAVEEHPDLDPEQREEFLAALAGLEAEAPKDETAGEETTEPTALTVA